MNVSSCILYLDKNDEEKEKGHQKNEHEKEKRKGDKMERKLQK